MALEVTSLQRKFLFNKVELQDIEGLTPNQIVKHYAGVYPEMTNSSVQFKKIEDGYEIYEITNSVGIKG